MSIDLSIFNSVVSLYNFIIPYRLAILFFVLCWSYGLAASIFLSSQTCPLLSYNHKLNISKQYYIDYAR